MDELSTGVLGHLRDRILALNVGMIGGALTIAACATVRTPVASSVPTCSETLDAGDLFSSEELEGVFVLRDEA